VCEGGTLGTMKHIGAVAAVALFVLGGCETAPDATIGPRGGSVVSDDGRFSLEIPAGALDTEVPVRITAVQCEPANALGPCYDVSPRGVGFHLPAIVTYELGGMQLGTIDAIRLNVIAERDDGWNVLADQEVDLEDEILSASAMYLSSYAIVAMP
jgi:hypothetical protein